MKLFHKIWLILLVLAAGSACDNTDLDLQVNPNSPTPDQASLNELYNNIQLTFRDVFNGAQGNPGAVARMYHAGGDTYENTTTPTSFNGLWGNVYSELLPDVDALIQIADETGGFGIHAASAKIMKAYAFMTLVDLFNNVPYSEAGKGVEFISPKHDTGESIYAAALGLLDDAIAQLGSTTAPAPATDLFYGGNKARWTTLAKTLKFRAALNMNDAGTINSLVSGGDLIDQANEDFQFSYGNQRSNPNTRHWMYNNHYEVGDGDYLSNYYMWLLLADKANAGGIDIIDPRRRYYFYQKVRDASAQDATTYSCHFSNLPTQSAKPAHWNSVDPRLPYCVVPNSGYSGRDHLNGEGIPPDGPIRTSYGLYPGGGQFDDDSATDTRKRGTTGGLGQGILPIMLSSFVDFMRAEAALRLGTTDNARALLESGMRKSMAKVIGFESLVQSTLTRTVTLRTGQTGVARDLYAAKPADVDNYVKEVLALYDAASKNEDKLAIVIKEYYIAAWGNGLEAYNMYRRTGFPKNIQPGLESSVGPFPLSFFLPNNHVDRNANVQQKTLSERVFWNANGPQLY